MTNDYPLTRWVSPIILAAVAMLVAALGLVANMHLSMVFLGILGGVVGVLLGIVSFGLAIKTNRSLILPVKSVLLSGVLLIAAPDLSGFYNNQPGGQSLQLQNLNLQHKIDFAMIDVRSIERKIQALQDKRDKNQIHPALLDQIKYVRAEPRFVNRMNETRGEIYRELHIDLFFKNESDLTFGYVNCSYLIVAPETDRKPEWLSGEAVGPIPPGGEFSMSRKVSIGTWITPDQAAEQNPPPDAETFQIETMPMHAGTIEDQDKRVPATTRGLADYELLRLHGHHEELGKVQTRIADLRKQIEQLE